MGWRYFHVNTQATFVVATPPCDLISVTVNKGATSATCSVFDTNLSGSTSVANTMAVIDASAAGNFFYGHEVLTGITITTAGGNADITVIFNEEDQPAQADLGDGS